MKRSHNHDFQLARSETYGAGSQSMSIDDDFFTTFCDYSALDQEAIATKKN